MSREELLENTVKYLKTLSDEKVIEVHDFVEFLYLKHEEFILQKGIQKLESESKSFLFLENEEDIYTVNDIKENIMQKGDVVLVPFPFTDLTGSKFRPALVLFPSLKDVTVAFITTQIKLCKETDIKLKPSSKNGLKKISVLLLDKIATLEKSSVVGKLGNYQLKRLF